MNSRRQVRKRRLEDELEVDSSRSAWSRRMEGFSDFVAENEMKSKRMCQHGKRASTFLESSFDVANEEQVSEQDPSKDIEVISWSSTDSEGELTEQLDGSQRSKRPKKSTYVSKSETFRGSQKLNTASGDVSKSRSSFSSQVRKSNKAGKLENKNLTQTFETFISADNSNDSIYAIANSSDEGKEEESEDDGKKPRPRLADLPKEVSPLKKSEKQTQESPLIGSIQSAHSSSSTSPGICGMKASDWMKAFDWRTPVKSGSQDEGDETVEPDSAKKKRIKYMKGGYAEQLFRLQAREKSSVRMWEHQTADSDISSSSKALLAKVTGYEMLHSLQVARCEVAEIEQGRTEEGVDMNLDRYDWKHQTILFSKQLSEKLQIATGAVVKIYPPWQQLHLKSLNDSVLMCTLYTRVIVPASICPQQETEDDWDCLRVVGTWNCPCSSDTSISLDDCPVKQFPHLPSLHQSNCQDSLSQEPGTSGVNCKTLQTVTSTQPAVPVAAVSQSLLESIQRYHGTNSISFRATVQRVFISPSSGFSLLVEDNHGTVAVINKGGDSDPDNFNEIEGRVCVFSGLKVINRLSKERNIPLFSVMKGAWSGQQVAVSSQESQEDSNYVGKMESPGFCYILAPTNSAVFSYSVSTAASSAYQEPRLSSLSEALQAQPERRASFLCRVIYRRMSDTTSNESKAGAVSQTWYLTDFSLSPKYTTLFLSTECHIPRKLGCMAFIRDVFLMKDNFHADAYTMISDHIPPVFDDTAHKEVELEQLKQLSVSLPSISDDVKTADLVSVEGEICSIDEDSAYTWEQCDDCGSDKLIEESGRISTCARCGKKVTSPITRMKMEVYLLCKKIGSQTKLKVDLLETTIQKLLPQETDSDEGYDIDIVLKKHVGPLQCYVISVNHCEDHKEILVNEFS